MSKGTNISYLHPPGLMVGATWSPFHGCTPVHAGCKNCWASQLNANREPIRFADGVPMLVHGKRQPSRFGPGRDRRVTVPDGWKHPLRWARAAAKAGKRMLVAPLDCDVLDAEVCNRAEAPEGVACRATFDRFMDLIRETGEIGVDALTGRLVTGVCETQMMGGITWLLLTKRPENWCWIPEDVRRFCWLIYSASDQPSLDAGMPHLRAARGFAGLGLSLEPLVGPIDLGAALCLWRGLGWVILGGESGSGARPCRHEWIFSLVSQCRHAGVATYVKQVGSEYYPQGATVPLRCRHGGTDITVLPPELRVREWPDLGGKR